MKRSIISKYLLGGVILLTVFLFGYKYWLAPTNILFVNIPEAQAADITLSNDSRLVKTTCLSTGEVSSFGGYDAVVLFGRGLYLSENQAAELEKTSKHGTPILTLSSQAALGELFYNITREQCSKLLEYFNNPNLNNYRNGLYYLRHIANPNRIFQEAYEEPVILPDNHYYHREYGNYFETKEGLVDYLKQKGIYNKEGKNIAFIAGARFPMEGNRAHVDTLISRLTCEGFNVFPIASPQYRTKMIKDLKPDAVIYYPMGRLGDDSFINWLNTENIPLFSPYPLIQSTKEWLDPMTPISGGVLNARVLVPEIDGAMMPLAIATQDSHESGYYFYKVEEERMNNFIQHVRKYLGLAKLPNKDKKVAICYFRSPGKDALLASGMEVIPSLYNFLKRLRSEGYDLTGLPTTLDGFKKRINTDGLVLGSYALGAQDDFLKHARPVWLTKEEYEKWAGEVLNPEKYEEVINRYGEAPGKLLVREDNVGNKEIAIACLQFGNIILFPQPRPALEDDDFKLVHGVPVAPPHSYLAPYLYMQKGFKADALIHFGTHGNLEFTPGKNIALSKNDWADVLVGDLPHFYFYTTGNVGEGIIAKRRTHAVLVTHLTPPYVESGMRQRYSSILNNIHYLLHEGNDKNKNLALQAKRDVIKLGLHRDLELDSLSNAPFTEQELEKLDLFMEEIANEKTLGAFYTMGETYSSRDLLTTTLAVSADPLAYQLAKRDRDAGKITTEQLQNLGFVNHSYLSTAKKRITNILQNTPKDTSFVEPDLKDAIKYRELLTQSTENEFLSMIRGLNGGSISPAPGGDPVLNPNVLPTGRNMYSINVETTPTKKSWEEGKRLAEITLNTYKEKHGEYPRKVSYTFWAGEFINSEGATIAQALWMLGVEPIRDNQDRIVDLKLVSSTELGRPRINVLIQVSGQLRDIAGSRLKLITDAVRLASTERDEQYPNYVLSGTILQEKMMIDNGMPPVEAREMSTMRVFGPLNSGYSTGMIAYTDNSGSWDDQNELVNGYLNNMGAIYGDDDNWGAFHKDLFASALTETDIIIQPRQSNTWGPISLDHVFEFTGAMSMAVKNITGKEPDALMADYRNRNNKRMQNLKEAVAVESRATILNPTFVEERMKGDATTAQMFGKIFRNIYGWQVMRPSSMDRELYNDLYKMYILDEHQLGIHDYFDNVNSATFQTMTSVMLESVRKGYWQATEEQLQQVVSVHIQSIKKNGAGCTEVICDNSKLQSFVTSQLSSEQATEYKKGMSAALEASKSDANGMVLKKTKTTSVGEKESEPNGLNGLLVVVIILLAFVATLTLLKKKRRS